MAKKLLQSQAQLDSSQIVSLEEFTKQLQKFQAFHRIWSSSDFQTYLLPELQTSNIWPKPVADLQEFQKEYFLSYGMAKAFDKLIVDLSTSDERARNIQQRIEREKLKHGR